jgi:hypothetical protein
MKALRLVELLDLVYKAQALEPLHGPVAQLLHTGGWATRAAHLGLQLEAPVATDAAGAAPGAAQPPRGGSGSLSVPLRGNLAGSTGTLGAEGSEVTGAEAAAGHSPGQSVMQEQRTSKGAPPVGMSARARGADAALRPGAAEQRLGSAERAMQPPALGAGGADVEMGGTADDVPIDTAAPARGIASPQTSGRTPTGLQRGSDDAIMAGAEGVGADGTQAERENYGEGARRSQGSLPSSRSHSRAGTPSSVQ